MRFLTLGSPSKFRRASLVFAVLARGLGLEGGDVEVEVEVEGGSGEVSFCFKREGEEGTGLTLKIGR